MQIPAEEIAAKQCRHTEKLWREKKKQHGCLLMTVTVLGIWPTGTEKYEMRAIDTAQFARTMAHSTMAIITVAVKSNLQN